MQTWGHFYGHLQPPGDIADISESYKWEESCGVWQKKKKIIPLESFRLPKHLT